MKESSEQTCGITWCSVVDLTPCVIFKPDSSFKFIEMKIRPKQWTYENKPRIALLQFKLYSHHSTYSYMVSWNYYFRNGYARCLRQTQAIWLYSVLVDKRHMQLSENHCCHARSAITSGSSSSNGRGAVSSSAST